MSIKPASPRTIFAPFTLQKDGSMKPSYLFPVKKTMNEARTEIMTNPLARQFALEYREMTASELLSARSDHPPTPAT